MEGKVKVLTIQFENELSPKDVSAFRGAIINRVNREHVLFHHHLSDTEVLFNYPLIQYKSIGGKSAILCLADATEEAYRIFSGRDKYIQVRDRKFELITSSIEFKTRSLQLFPDLKFSFALVNWLALNQKNLGVFNSIQNPLERVQMLEKILIANILAFAKGVEWTITESINVLIEEVRDQRIVRFKGIPIIAFDVVFKVNIDLPLYLGLGKSASHGYGMIKRKIHNSK
jgi:hypothetical protein